MTKATTHKCAAKGCERQIPLDMLMCSPHWARVPKHLKTEVNKQYRTGQEIRQDPTELYLKAARAAVDAIETADAIQKQEQQQGILL